MTLTCDVGTQTTYPPFPVVVAPNVTTAYDEHRHQALNPRPLMIHHGNHAIFSPNKSEAAFALSSLFHGGDESGFQGQSPPMAAAAAAMTSNDSTASSTSPQSTSPITYSTNHGPQAVMMMRPSNIHTEYAFNNINNNNNINNFTNGSNNNNNNNSSSHHGNVNNNAMPLQPVAHSGVSYAAPDFATPNNYCHHSHAPPSHHPHGHPMMTQNTTCWGSPCGCHHPYNTQSHNPTNSCNSHTSSNSNSNNTTWEPLPSRVSPGQYRNNNSNNNSDERRNVSNWNQETAMMQPTPNHWTQPQPPSTFAAKNPMQVILEAARFAPSPVVSANNHSIGGFRGRGGEDLTSSMLTGKRLRDISNDQSMVTPTPIPKEKKLRIAAAITSNAPDSDTPSRTAAAYSRKNKSLGVLAESFVKKYEDSPVGTNIVIDDTAIEFQVERRRIYDIIAILESLEFITRRHKNTYSWNGRVKLSELLGRLQAEAIATWPDVAESAGLLDPSTDNVVEPSKKDSNSHEPKSLGRLTQSYLKLFLVGHKPLSLPEASNIMNGEEADEYDAIESSDAAHSKSTANRVLKTRIRRLYDIANCASRIGFLRKVDSEDSRRPKFAWAYPLSPLEIKQLYSENSPTGLADSPAHQASPTGATAPGGKNASPPPQQMDHAAACNGKVSPPQAEDRLFLAQIHQRGAEDDCGVSHNESKATLWNEQVSIKNNNNHNNRAMVPLDGGVGPQRTVSIMSSDWDGIVAEHHGHAIGHPSHFCQQHHVPPHPQHHQHQQQHRSPTMSWDDDNSAPPSHHPSKPFARNIITSTTGNHDHDYSNMI